MTWTALRVRRLEAELTEAVTVRESLEQPPGLVVGLVVLAFLTIASVIVPGCSWRRRR